MDNFLGEGIERQMITKTVDNFFWEGNWRSKTYWLKKSGDFCWWGDWMKQNLITKAVDQNFGEGNQGNKSDD